PPAFYTLSLHDALPIFRKAPHSRGFFYRESSAMPQMPSLSQLQQPDAFLRRHLGPDESEQKAMLEALGLASREQLIEQTVPPAIRLQGELELPAALDEQQALKRLRSYAEQNELWTSLIGMGYHGTITPPVILRNLLE